MTFGTPLYVTTPHTKKLQATLLEQREEHTAHEIVGSVFVVSVPESGVPHHTSVYAAANEQVPEVGVAVVGVAVGVAVDGVAVDGVAVVGVAVGAGVRVTV